MSRVVAIANQKGGVGKTTTCVNLAVYLAASGQKVLLVDIDPQCNATSGLSGLGIDQRQVGPNVYDVLIEGVEASRAVRRTAVDGLWVLPSSLDLAGGELMLVNMERREHRLREALAPIREAYRFIYIDCPPSLGLLTVNALVAADALLVPIQCEYYALEGVSQLMDKTVKRVIQTGLNPQLELDGVVLTMFDARTNLSIQVVDDVKRRFRGKVYRSIVPRNVRLAEAPSHRIPIAMYDARSRGAEVYAELAREVLERADA